MGTPVIQVVGYQNSGKTTFLEKMIAHFKMNNFGVGVLKHHGHGGAPDLGPEKDSKRHLRAGAVASCVEGDGTMLLIAKLNESGIEEKLQLLNNIGVDIIFVEGYKQLPYPKIVLVRHHKDLELIEKLENIIAVVAWDEVAEIARTLSTCKQFAVDDPSISLWVEEQYLDMKNG